MRVLIFSLAYEPFVGGAEVAVREITKRLSDFEFDLVTLNLNGQEKSFEQIDNVNVYRLKGVKLLFPFKAFFFAVKLHKRKPYDLSWSIMSNYAGFAALFFKKRFPGVKFILTLQEGDPIEYIKKRVGLLYPLFKNIFVRADKVQAISHFLGNWAREMGQARQIEIIPNGVDVERFLNPSPKVMNKNDITLITTSRLVKKNGLEDVIEALSILPKNVGFKIIGVGDLEADLKEQVERLDLENRVEFLGFVSQEQMPSHLHKADIFIRPSLSEGQGVSFIEAMAAGLPVIATPVGGIPDFLKDGETGIFCQPNDPKSIVEAVERLVGDDLLRERVRRNALKMVKEKYDWDLIAQEMRSRVFNI